MPTKASILAATIVGVAQAQDYFWVPDSLVGSFCDGISRPDWEECESHYVDDFLSTEMRIGPGFLDGQTFTYENCEVKYIQCTSSGYEWVMDGELGLFAGAKAQCGDLNAAGVQRQGDLCVLVQNPSNPLVGAGRRKRDVDARGEIVEQPATPVKDSSSDKTERSHPKDIGATRDVRRSSSPLERRQECSGGGSCYEYTESSFAANIRGIEERVCDSILPDGGSCAETTSVTVTEGYTVGFDVTTGLKDVVDVSASFTSEYSEAIETSLRTTITVDCPGGSGYIVWYPLMEISRGRCGQGSCSGGYCQNVDFEQCEFRRPIQPSDGSLSGEYDYICI